MSEKKLPPREDADLFKRIPAIEDAIEEWGRELDQIGESRLVGMAPGFRKGAMWMHSVLFKEHEALLRSARADAFELAADTARSWWQAVEERRGPLDEEFLRMAKAARGEQ